MSDGDSLAIKVWAIQDPIMEQARSYAFTHKQVQDLRCLIRLAVEFQEHLQSLVITAIDFDELHYLTGCSGGRIASTTWPTPIGLSRP
jgi:hypothetical protein